MQLNPVFKAISDPTRRKLLEILRSGPRTTGDLCASFHRLSRYAVMKHLRILEKSRLVRARKQGRVRWNSLDSRPLIELERRWIRQYRNPKVQEKEMKC